jgi:hypothetical protein
MYRYLDISLSDNIDKIIKESSIITDIDFITNYIYNYSYNIIKQKFNLFDVKYQNTIYLNPYARTILILKVAKEYLKHKINIVDVVKLNSESIIPENTKNLNNQSSLFLNKCKEYIKFLYLFNGEVKFNPVSYKKVDINDESFTYIFIKQFAEKYLSKSELTDLNRRCIIPNNMFSDEECQHVHFNVSIDTIDNDFYNLQL